VATVTGDAVMLRPDDFGARIAFVDYEGKKAFDNHLKSPPQTPEAETQFVEANAPRMIQGVEMLKNWVDFLLE
jgi:aspartate aminotransferase